MHGSLHMSAVLAITRGHAIEFMSSDIRITDRPSERVPRDTLSFLLLETPLDTQLGTQLSTSYHYFCGDLGKICYIPRVRRSQIWLGNGYCIMLYFPRFIPFPCLLHNCAFCPWAFDLQPSCIHSLLDVTYHHRAHLTHLQCRLEISASLHLRSLFAKEHSSNIVLTPQRRHRKLCSISNTVISSTRRSHPRCRSTLQRSCRP